MFEFPAVVYASAAASATRGISDEGGEGAGGGYGPGSGHSNTTQQPPGKGQTRRESCSGAVVANVARTVRMNSKERQIVCPEHLRTVPTIRRHPKCECTVMEPEAMLVGGYVYA